MARILGIDTSTLTASAAVVIDGEAAAAEDVRTGTHSEELMPLIARLMARAGIAPRDLDAIAVGAGPGSFTGLRIGLATLKAFALDEARPVVPVSTLAALAAAAVDAPGPVAAILDARRGEVYAAACARAGEPEPALLPDTVATPEELAERLPHATTLVVGEDAEGAAARLGALRPDLVRIAGVARAARVGRLARRVLAGGRALAPAAVLVPRYVRRAEAEARRTGQPLEPPLL
jgi:tRNA threonylcarbamoyladenosine biosynthesis protein TsaB